MKIGILCNLNRTQDASRKFAFIAAPQQGILKGKDELFNLGCAISTRITVPAGELYASPVLPSGRTGLNVSAAVTAPVFPVSSNATAKQSPKIGCS
jgi:hypothetical protein